MKTDIAGLIYKFPVIDKIIQSLSLPSSSGKVILITGQPGSGKSVFMHQLYDILDKKVKCLTAVSAELLTQNESPQKYYELFQQYENLEDAKILLLDSLDVLAYSRRRELQEWLYYVDKLKKIKGMTVVCASRSFEAEHLYPMSQQEWSEKININLFPDEFINKIFDSLKYNYTSISPRFREFLRIPLHLRIIADIIVKGGDPKDISTLQGLYARLCELLPISTDEMKLLTSLAEQMINDRTIYVSYPSINVQLLDNIKKMERPGLLAIIQVDSTNQRLSFSHQTLIDYFIAWRVINEGNSIIDFVSEHKQSLFIRPTLRHILGFLRSSSEKRLFEELSKLFLGEVSKKIGFNHEHIRMHIKTAVLADMASWDKPTIEEGKFLLRILNDASDKQTLMIQFFNSDPNPEWYIPLKDIYIYPILKQRDEADITYRVVLSFLSSITKHYPSEVLDISLSLLVQKHNRTIEWFFHRISDQLHNIKELNSSLHERYATFLEERVRKGFADRHYEIQVCCKRIARYFPEKGLKLYLDYIIKELQDNDSKIYSSQGSLTQSFDEVLPYIYQETPYLVLISLTDFFEMILSENYSGKKELWDHPNGLLYAEHAERFGLEAFYHWYKSKVLEFCSNMNGEVERIVSKLECSKWKSPRQLAMLCKIQHPLQYKKDILTYVDKILSSDLTDNAMYEEDELYIRVLRKAFDVMDDNKRNSIINKILRLNFEDRLQVRIWVWTALHNIPERYHNYTVNTKLKELSKKYNFEKEYKYRPPIQSTGFQAAQPPVPIDVLRSKIPNELYKFLVENKNLKDRWGFDENSFFGGVEELAKTAAGLFLEDMNKYKIVVQDLAKDAANDEYILWFFYALSEKEAQTVHCDWIIDIIQLVYKREKLELAISRYLEKICDIISEVDLNRLKNIIISLSKSNYPEKDTFFESRAQGYGNDALGDGINRTRGSVPLLVVKLLSKFKEDWLGNILIELANDPTISVRAALVRYLPYAIKSLGWDKCFEIFSTAFQKGPEEYTEIIPHFLQYTPKERYDQVQEVLDKMKEKRNGNLGESFANVMTIYYLKGMCSADDLIELLKDPVLLNRGKEESFNLLANHVKFESAVDKSLKIINTLLDQEDVLEGKVSILFMQARVEDLKKFIPIIERIIGKPKIRGECLYYILEYLEKCILIDPVEVFCSLEKILSNVSDDFHNMRDFIPASHSKAPLNIINTILECYPELEERAMKALDKLIEVGWEGVKDYLYTFDRF